MDCLSLMESWGVFEEQAISQEEYMRRARNNLFQARHRVAFLGYDKPFMEAQETQQLLDTVITRHEVTLSGILPENIETYLHRYKNNPLVSLFRLPMSSHHGFILVDADCVMYWNSRKLTPHPEERHHGVYYREIILDKKEVLEWADVMMVWETKARRHLKGKMQRI